MMTRLSLGLVEVTLKGRRAQVRVWERVCARTKKARGTESGWLRVFKVSASQRSSSSSSNEPRLRKSERVLGGGRDLQVRRSERRLERAQVRAEASAESVLGRERQEAQARFRMSLCISW